MSEKRSITRAKNSYFRLFAGQSVDTSVLHKAYPEFDELPILTSVGCAFRRPQKLLKMFDRGLRDRVGARQELFVDSGGFVLMGEESDHWSAESVAAIYRKIDADFLASLDVPPLPTDASETRSAKYRITQQNLAYLAHEFGSKIVPVLHGHNEMELRSNALEISKIQSSPTVLGLGGLVPWLQRSGSARRDKPTTPQRRVKLAIRVAKQHFPESRIHLFGVGSVHTALGVMALGASSIDSIGWRQAAGFGSVYIPKRHRRLLTDRKRDRLCRPVIDDEDREILMKCVCPICSRVPTEDRISNLQTSFATRALHNIWVLQSEIDDFETATTNGTATDFLEQRLPAAWLAPISE